MYYSSATDPQLTALTRLGQFNNSPLCSPQQTDTMLNNGYSDIGKYSTTEGNDIYYIIFLLEVSGPRLLVGGPSGPDFVLWALRP